MLKTLLYRTIILTRFNLKKDFKRMCIWLSSLFVFTLAIAQYYINTPMSDIEKAAMVETLNSPIMALLIGTIPNAEVTTGLMFALEMTLFSVIIVAIMNIFMVTHSTRQDEEIGRLEIIRSLPTGRLSNLAAAIIQAFIVNLILAVSVGLGLGMLDFGANSMSSGLLYGFALGMSGFMFAMFVALFAQLFQSNRSVITFSLAFLGLNFIFRGITDISNPDLSYISPLSWCYKTEVYANDYWLPIILMIVASLIMGVMALYLNSIRDLDGCFIKQKPGKTHASKALAKPFGLVSRLNKTTFISWVVGIAVLGVTFGSMFSDLETFFANNTGLQEMFPGFTGEDFAKQFMTLTANMFALFIVIPILTFIGKIYGEEKRNHLENVISKSVAKNKILGMYLAYSLIVGIVFVVTAIISIYITGHTSIGFSDVLKGILVYIPAIGFMLGLAVFLVGLFPKLFASVWVLIGYAFFITYFGMMFKLPNWIQGLSPFYHIPEISTANYNFVPLIILTILGTLLTFLGFKFYKKRDITA